MGARSSRRMDEKQVHEDVLTNINSFLARCWLDAIEAHNHGLSKAERSRRWIHLASPNGDLAVITAEALLGSALKAEGAFQVRQGPLAKLSSGLVKQFRRHSKAIDILCQIQPPVGIAVWFPIRVILEIVHDKDEASETAIEGIHLLVRHLDRWTDIATDFAREIRVREALVNLYTYVLDFLQWAVKHLERGGSGRFCGSILSSKKDKFRRKLDQLKKAEQWLEKEVESKDKRAAQDKLVAIHEMMVKFDSALDQIAQSKEQRGTLGLDRFRGASSMERFFEYNMDTLRELDAKSQQRTWVFRRVLKWLKTAMVHIDTDAEKHSTTSKSDGEWLLTRQEFSSWLATRNNAVLWLEGRPGCGKTTLSTVVMSRLRNNTRTKSPQVFFCSFNSSQSPQSSNPSSFAAAFLFQLLEMLGITQQPSDKDSDIITELHKLSNQHPLGPQTCSFKKLWSICLNALRMQNTKRFLILDALDECCFDGDNSTSPEEFFTQVLELGTQIPQFKMAIFTRPRAAFSPFSSSVIRISIDADSVEDDILRYASATFDALQIRAEYKDEVLQQLASRHEGCFLWVKLYLEYLAQAHNDRVFRDRLYGCPAGLSSLYDKMAQARSTSLQMHDENWIALRQDLHGLVCVALLPLLMVDVANILGIDHFDPARFIRELGEPFLMVDDGRVRLIHASVRDYLTTTQSSPQQALVVSPIKYHARVAVECLECLLEPQYGLKGRIGLYLHRNLNTAVLAEISDESSGRISFEYAWQYWEVHLMAVGPNPDDDLLHLVQRFLHSFQFAYWSEFTLFRLGGFSLIRTTAQHLNQWHKKLPGGKKSLVTVDDYFVQPYRALTDAYQRDRRKDEELQWLSRMQLGYWLRDIDKPEESADVLTEVVPALTRLFGTTHPLTLQAKTTAAALYIPQRRYREANHDYTELARVEEEELGMTDSPKLYATMLGLGHTQLLMNSYAESMETQDRASRGFSRLNGPNDSSYQSSRLLYAFALMERGELAVAFEVLSGILKRRQDLFGKEDLFSTTAQCAMGDIQRKQNSRTESLANLKAAFALRKTLFALSIPFLMDNAILLLVAYRDFDMRDDARAIIGKLDRDGNLNKHFSQACQVAHLRALLDHDDGKVDDAIARLQDLLVQTHRARYNRPLLWIMLDLAVMLRSRDKPDDREQAASNFDNILVDLDAEEYVIHTAEQQLRVNDGHAPGDDDDDDDEPDPPRLLRLAEKALTLVRNREFDRQKALFEVENVDWRRSDDLWLPYGVPPADTAWMKGPRIDPGKSGLAL